MGRKRNAVSGVVGPRVRPSAARCYTSYGYPLSDYHMREFPPHPYRVAMLGAPICSCLSWARKTAPKGGFRDFGHRHRKKRLLEARTTLIYTSDVVWYLLKSPPHPDAQAYHRARSVNVLRTSSTPFWSRGMTAAARDGILEASGRGTSRPPLRGGFLRPAARIEQGTGPHP